MLKRIFDLIASTTFILFLTMSVANVAMASEIKVSSPVPPSHIVTKVAVKANEFVKEASKGQISLDIHPYGKFGNIPVVISLLQNGALELGLVPLGDIALRDPAFYGWFVPLTFKSFREAALAIDTKVNKRLMERLIGQGLVPLAFVFPGQRHVLSTFPVKNIQDFKGKKVRAFPNEAFKEWWRAVGASPSVYRLPELPQALQTGVLDAVDTDLDLVIGLKLHKMAKYLVLTNHMAFPCVYLASKVWWDKISKKEQDIIRTAFKDAEKWGIEAQTKLDIENLEKLKEDGAIVTKLKWEDLVAPAQKAKANIEKLNPMIKEFQDEVAK